MASNNSSKDSAWETLKRTYEGFPLYLRRPVGLDFDALAPKFKVQVALTHTFSFRRFDGAPEPIYNKSLEEFDLSVTRYFDQSGDGQVVLVKTFGGKRNYYFYVAASVDLDAMVSDLRGRFPGYNLEVQSASDPEWSFIRRYTSEFLNEA
jgi:hypothetical protein